MGLPKFYLQEICIMKIASPWSTLQRQPFEPKRKIPQEAHLLSHSNVVKDGPWDKSRDYSYVEVKLGPAPSLSIINHFVISPSLCISVYRVDIPDIKLSLISNITLSPVNEEGKKVKIDQSPFAFHK